MNILAKSEASSRFDLSDDDDVLINPDRVWLAAEGVNAGTTQVFFEVDQSGSSGGNTSLRDVTIKVDFDDYKAAVGFCDLTS